MQRKSKPEGHIEKGNRQTNMKLEEAEEHLLMRLIRDRILTETGDKVRVQTDREAVAMIAKKKVAEMIAE